MRRRWWLASAWVLVAVPVAVAVLLPRGGGESADGHECPVASTQPTGTVQSVAVDGWVDGVTTISDCSVWVATREGSVLRLDSNGSMTEDIDIGPHLPQAPPNMSFYSTSAMAASADAVWLVVEQVDNDGVAFSPTLVKIDVSEGTVGGSLPLFPTQESRESEWLAVGANQVWVEKASSDHSVSRIDPATVNVDSTIEPPVEGYGIGLAIDEDENLWIGATDEVSMIDPATGAVVSTVAVPSGEQSGSGVNPFSGAGSVWVCNTPAGLYRVDPRARRVTSVTADSSCAWIEAVTDDAVYVMTDGNELRRIEAATSAVTQSIPIGFQLLDVAVSGATCWLVDFEGQLSRVTL